jgi:hypothetical protein
VLYQLYQLDHMPAWHQIATALARPFQTHAFDSSFWNECKQRAILQTKPSTALSAFMGFPGISPGKTKTTVYAIGTAHHRDASGVTLVRAAHRKTAIPHAFGSTAIALIRTTQVKSNRTTKAALKERGKDIANTTQPGSR